MAKAAAEEIVAMIERREVRLAELETAEDLSRLRASFPAPRDAVAYIVDTFPIEERRDEAKYGDYRTKLLILGIYDRMQEAIVTGRPYETILSPPPADPSVAHPASGNWPINGRMMV
jgi:hypothetical protein